MVPSISKLNAWRITKRDLERIAEDMAKRFLDLAPQMVKRYPEASGSFKIAYIITLERKGVKP